MTVDVMGRAVQNGNTPMKSDVQIEVQRLFDRLVAEDKERGLQAAVYFRGELVVHAWAGLADPVRGVMVDGRTLFPVFSCGKGVTATLIHRLVERGVLAYDQPIASVWPEFGAAGKDAVTVRHALNHTAGLHLMPAGLDYAMLCNWDTLCTVVARMAPVWAPGSRAEYHAITFGWILGGLACRATGRTFDQLLEEEIRAPIGLKDMFIGITDEVEARVAVLEEIGTPGVFPAGADVLQSVPDWLQPLYIFMNRPDVRRACIPASNGIMSAHDLARHYAALLPGGVEGVALLPPSRVARVRETGGPHMQGISSWGLGYGLGGEGSVMGHRETCFGHGGHGGSLGFVDLDHELAVGFVRNRLRDPSGVDTVRLLVEAVRRCLRAQD